MESTHKNTSTVTVQLISLESKAFAGPGVEIKPLEPCECPPLYTPSDLGSGGSGPDGPTPTPPPGPGTPTPTPEPEPPLREPEDPDCCPDAVGLFVVKTRVHAQIPTKYYCNGVNIYQPAEYLFDDYELEFEASDIRVYTSKTREYVQRCAGSFDPQKTALSLYTLFVQGAGCSIPYKEDGEWWPTGVFGGSSNGGEGESTKPTWITVRDGEQPTDSNSIIRWGEVLSVTKDGVPFTPQRFPFTPYPDLSPHPEPYYDCDNCDCG